MLWRSGPILTYQCMWYAPGMGKGAAKPCIGTICYPSILTWGRMKQMELKKELEITPLWLQHHLQTAACKTVQSNLLLLDEAFGPPGTNFPGGIRNFGLSAGTRSTGIQDAWGWSACLFAYLSLVIQHPSSGVQCEIHFADCKICLLSTTCFSIQGKLSWCKLQKWIPG